MKTLSVGTRSNALKDHCSDSVNSIPYDLFPQCYLCYRCKLFLVICTFVPVYYTSTLHSSFLYQSLGLISALFHQYLSNSPVKYVSDFIDVAIFSVGNFLNLLHKPKLSPSYRLFLALSVVSHFHTLLTDVSNFILSVSLLGS